MDRVIRDGKIAVLVSPGFGAGWSTWASSDVVDMDVVLFEPEVVEWVLNGKEGSVPDLADKYGWHFYTGGADTLEVVWIEQGQRFRIHEYDGSEHVVLEQDEEWFTA